MSPSARHRDRIVIVGAGLAGAATACHLAANGHRDLVILEKERLPGMHSSGRNAAMIRQVVRPTAVARMAREGARALAELAGPAAGFGFVQNGSLLLGSRAGLAALRDELAGAGALAPDCELITGEGLALEVQALEGCRAEAALWTPGDGVVDVAGLLDHYLREARRRGATLMTETQFFDVVREGDRIVGVQTSAGYIEAGVLVNAAGPWVGKVAEIAGASPIPFAPLRRHLFFTGPLDDVDPAWPFCWDVENDWYIRPESGGLLLCAGDESLVAAGEPDLDPAITNLLEEKLQAHAPGLGDLPIARLWAGLRTFSPDRSFVIGWDPRLEGFFWVAGLGGHGVTTSWEVGRLAARLIGGKAEPMASSFAVDRFEDR
ncbi:MAG: FAD-binding oxidoreductase [Planctomycetes bacterium]|nr:FAD-binding oxidoreductase [Planctomycetota bacterium]